MSDYILIHVNNNPNQLEEFVKARLKQGYIPAGGIFIVQDPPRPGSSTFTTTYYQAVYKP